MPTPPLPERFSPQQAADAARRDQPAAWPQHVRRSGHGRAAFSSLVLRSLKQAYYTPRNVGHAGLGELALLPLHLADPPLPGPGGPPRAAGVARASTPAAPRAPELDEAGEHCSSDEREAMKIERDADDVCMAFLLERRLHEHGLGPADSTARSSGWWAAARSCASASEGFEGFLPARALRGEWWELNEHGTALVAEGSGKTIKLGDPVAVAVRRVDAPRGRVDLVPAMLD